MAYVIKHNDPSPGYVSWSNMNMAYNGTTYAIANGNSNKIFIYWLLSAPTVMQTSDTFPTLTHTDVVVILNKNGIATLVPGSTILDGSLIVPGTILADALSANSVTSAKIMAGSIQSTHISTGAIVADSIAAGAIGAAAIAAGAVISDHILAGNVLATHIIAGAIQTAHIAAGAVTANEIASNAVTTVKLNALAVTAEKIAAGTITAAKLKADEILSNWIFAGTVQAITGTFTNLTAGNPTGARLELGRDIGPPEAPFLNMYDSVNKLRVRLEQDKIAFYDSGGALAGRLFAYSPGGGAASVLSILAGFSDSTVSIGPIVGLAGVLHAQKVGIVQMYGVFGCVGPDDWLRLVSGGWTVLDFEGDTLAKFQTSISAGGHTYPAVTNAYDLGTSALRWKDLYLAGNLWFSGAAAYLGTTSSHDLYVRTNNINRLRFYNSDTIESFAHFRPSPTATYDLGTTTLRWRSLYLSGTLFTVAVTATGTLSGGDLEISGIPTITTPSPRINFVDTADANKRFRFLYTGGLMYLQSRTAVDGVQALGFTVDWTTGNITMPNDVRFDKDLNQGANTVIDANRYFWAARIYVGGARGVPTDDIRDLAVSTGKIAANAVTSAKTTGASSTWTITTSSGARNFTFTNGLCTSITT